MVDIGKKIKTLRKGRGLTQQELADHLGLVRATISNYEIGRRTPHLSELKRIAEFFGVSLSFFGIDTTDKRFELLSSARDLFNDSNIPLSEKERLYRG